MEWVLIFVVQTSVAMVGLTPIYFHTYFGRDRDVSDAGAAIALQSF
jgi:hypothetical protein